MTEFISTCSMPLAIVFLIAGFFFLVKGADVFVEGSSSIAKRFHVPAIIIGLTIVAMGTSLPETAVSVVAAIQHKNTLAISNVVGSNIFNMMVVIGFCAIMTPVAVQKATLKRDFPYSVFAALLLMILGGVGMKLGRFDSAVFLVFFAIFIGTMIRMALKAGKEGGQPQSEEIEAAEAQKVMSMPKSLLFLVVGVAGIVIGGDERERDGDLPQTTCIGLSTTLAPVFCSTPCPIRGVCFLRWALDNQISCTPPFSKQSSSESLFYWENLF